jgi:hypothetical protein
MGLNVDECGEDRLLILFVGRENQSASRAKIYNRNRIVS